jgi:hypothetical protein
VAFRIGERLIYGELRNLEPWQTFGHLWLRGEKQPLAIELTGNCAPDLQGRAIRFAPRRAASIAEYLDGLKREEAPLSGETPGFGEASGFGEAPGFDEARFPGETPASGGTPASGEIPASGEAPLPDLFFRRHIGVPGDMTAARWVRSLPCSVSEYLARLRLGEKPPTTWKRALYLEWFSRNGRVVVELEDPLLEYQDGETWKPLPCPVPMPERDPDDPPGNPASGLEVIAFDAEGHTKRIVPETDEEASRDGLPEWMPAGLQKMLDARAADVDRRITGEDEDDDSFLAELELMDDLMESGSPDPPASLLGRRRLPRPDAVSEKQAESLVKGLLLELALWGLAVHACPHSTARQLYRILVEHVLFEEGVHPELADTGWTQNLLAAEYCPECIAELEAEFKDKSDE